MVALCRMLVLGWAVVGCDVGSDEPIPLDPAEPVPQAAPAPEGDCNDTWEQAPTPGDLCCDGAYGVYLFSAPDGRSWTLDYRASGDCSVDGEVQTCFAGHGEMFVHLDESVLGPQIRFSQTGCVGDGEDYARFEEDDCRIPLHLEALGCY